LLSRTPVTLGDPEKPPVSQCYQIARCPTADSEWPTGGLQSWRTEHADTLNLALVDFAAQRVLKFEVQPIA
jgi:hypothetical protein